MTRTRRSNGTALLTAVIATLLIAGFAGIYLALAAARQKQTRAAVDGQVAQSLAESAAASYVNYLNQPGSTVPASPVEWPDAAYPGAVLDPSGTYFVLKHMSGGQFHCRVAPLPNNKLLVTGVGEYDGVLKVVNVTTTAAPTNPLPPAGDAGAINIFGFPGQNIDFNYSITQGSGVQGGVNDPSDPASGPNTPALVIQDPDTMNAPDITQFLTDLENDPDLRNKFDGGQTAPYDANGDGTFTDLSIVNNPNLAVNQDTMEAFRQSLVTAADAGTATAFGYPSGTPVFRVGSFTQSVDRTTNFGTTANPQVTYIDGNVNVVNGTLKGTGTLVVRGSLSIGENTTTTTATTTSRTFTERDPRSGREVTVTVYTTTTTTTTTNPPSSSTTTTTSSRGTVGTTTSSTTTDGKLDWDGDIVVVGTSGASPTSPSFTINTPGSPSSTGNLSGGGLYVVSNQTSASFNLISGNATFQNGTAAVTLSSPSMNSTLNITGGTMQIQGVMVEMGGTQADLRTQADGSPSGGSLTLNGSVFVGVHQDNGQVNVDLNDQMHISYNQNFYENALNHINTLINSVATPLPNTFAIESYAENFAP